MCKFFSLVSDGKGNVKFFKPEDVVSIMASGNPDGLDFNSHTSLMKWLGIKAKDEEKYAKWEYDPSTKKLVLDEKGPGDDDKKVQKFVDKFFDGKDIPFIRNLYGRNSGYSNSGYRNSGDGNSGNSNSGNRNSGYSNSGYRNSGDGNSGYSNSGNRNSGYSNSGNSNSGNRNSGDGNSGNRNSGDGNSGNRNSGDGNSGDGVLNSFCTKRSYILFDAPCTKEEYEKINGLPWSWFWVTRWVSSGDMTEAQRAAHPYHTTTGGFLEHREYKEAWKDCPKEFISEVKKLKNYDADKFFEITGLREILS